MLKECKSSDLVGLLQVRRLLDQVKFKGETAAKTLLQYLEQTEPSKPKPEDKENHISAGMRHILVVVFHVIVFDITICKLQ